LEIERTAGALDWADRTGIFIYDAERGVESVAPGISPLLGQPRSSPTRSSVRRS